MVDTAYLSMRHETAGQAADHYGWRRVACVDAQGNLRTIEDLHEEIWSMISEVL